VILADRLIPALRLATTVVTGLQAGVSYAHALQAPGKRALPARDLMRFQTEILKPYRLGTGAVEALTLIGALSLLAGHPDRRGRRRAAATAAVTAAAIGVWAVAIEPINGRLSTWRADLGADEIPDDWQELRDRWHRLHGVRLLLLLVAAGAAAAVPPVARPCPS